MQTTLAVLALASVAVAQIPSITATGSVPGCTGSYPSPFQYGYKNLTGTKRSEEIVKREELILTLKNGVLIDTESNSAEYVASNKQIQAGPPQAGEGASAGWAVCPNNSLALGATTIFWNCKTGQSADGPQFYNQFSESIRSDCYPVNLVISPVGGSGAAGQSSDSQPTAVSQLSDSQPGAATQLSDSQPGAATQLSDSQPGIATQLSDSQPGVATGGPVASQLPDSQPGIATVATQLSDSQPGVATPGPVASQLPDSQPGIATSSSGPVATQLPDSQPGVAASSGVAKSNSTVPFTGAANNVAVGASFAVVGLAAVVLL